MSEQKDTLDAFEKKLVAAVEAAATQAKNEERLRQSKILARRVSMIESKFEAEKARLAEDQIKDIQAFLLENIKKVQETVEDVTLADIEAELKKVQEGAIPLAHREEEMPFGYEEEEFGEAGGDINISNEELDEMEKYLASVEGLSEGVLDRVDSSLLKSQRNDLLALHAYLEKSGYPESERLESIIGVVNFLEAVMDNLEGFGEALDPKYRLQRPTKVKGELMKQRQADAAPGGSSLQRLAAHYASKGMGEEEALLKATTELEELGNTLSSYNPIKDASSKSLAALKSRYGGGRMSYEGYEKEDRIRRIEARLRRVRVQRQKGKGLEEGKASDLVGNPVTMPKAYGPTKEIGDALAWYEKHYKSEGKNVLKMKMKEEAVRRAKLREAILQIQSDRKVKLESTSGSIERKFALAGKGEEVGDPLKQNKAKRESHLFDETSATSSAKVKAKKAPALKLEGLEKVTKGLSVEAKKLVAEAVTDGRIKSASDLKAFLVGSTTSVATPAKKTAKVETEAYGYDIPQGVDC